MAFTEFCCRSGGNNLYAGSLDGSAEASTTPLVTYTNGGWNSGTGVFTPASGNPVSAGVAVGNWVSVYVDGASAPTNFVARVTAVSSTTITLSTTAKSGTAPTTAASGVTAVVGGAWAGPSGASGFPFGFVQNTATNSAGDYPRVNFKNDQTYSVTAAMTHANAGPIFWQGYTSAFGDLGRATIDGGTSGASYVVLTVSVAQQTLRDFKFQNNGATGSAILLSSTGSRFVLERSVVTGSRGHGVSSTGNAFTLIECEVHANNASNTAGTAGVNANGGSSFIRRCTIHDNTGSNTRGVILATGSVEDCVIESNGSHGIEVAASNQGGAISNNAIYNNGGSGAWFANGGYFSLDNNVISQNGAYGVTNGGSNLYLRLTNNAFYLNSSGQTSGTVDAAGSITLTGSPFVDAANGDFRLNNTAGAGAACRGAGRGTFTQTAASYAGTVGYPDIGAAQHLESASSVFPVIGCGFIKGAV